MRLAIYLCEVAPFEIFQFAIRFFGVSLQFSQFESHFRDLSSKPVPLLPNALDFILKGCDLESVDMIQKEMGKDSDSSDSAGQY